MEQTRLDELKRKWYEEATNLFRLKGKDIYKHVQEQERNYLDRIERKVERERESGRGRRELSS